MEMISALLIFGLIYILFIAIFIAIVRWLFRINEIAGYLKRIADKIAPLDLPESSLPIEQGQCSCCHKYFPASKLTKTEMNKVLCPNCVKLL
jgi:hypothetical protein